MTRSAALPTLTSVLAASTLALVGCAAPMSTGETSESLTTTDSGCTGIEVLVEFGDLDNPSIAQCVETDAPMTALDAFTAAGVSIDPSEAYGDAIVCRVDGQPDAETELSTEQNGPYTETCAEFGPIWASWSLWVDFGSGWELGQEAVNTQPIAPGERVSLVWQQGDYTDMVEWLAPKA